MPGLTGVEAAALVRDAHDPPAVVFVTAHERYALEAFAVEAFDYLLKPVDPERLARLVERLGERSADYAAPVARVAVVTARGSELLDYDQIHFVQADGDYSRVHTYDRSYLCTASLADLERQLPAGRFARVHRSHLVNLAKVSAVRRPGPDHVSLQLADAGKTELPVARRQVRQLRERLSVRSSRRAGRRRSRLQARLRSSWEGRRRRRSPPGCAHSFAPSHPTSSWCCWGWPLPRRSARRWYRAFRSPVSARRRRGRGARLPTGWAGRWRSASPRRSQASSGTRSDGERSCRGSSATS